MLTASPTGVSLDHLPDATLVLDADCRVVAANAAVTRLLGWSPGELTGDGLGPDRLDPRGEDGRALCAGGWPPATRLPTVTALAEQLVSVRHRDGRRVEVALTGALRRGAGGAVEGAVLGLRDASRRARATTGGAVEIVTTVSHELRSPLTSVKGYSSLLLHRWDRLTDDQKQMMLTQINHDADRVTRLIGELLDISRLESGRLVLRRQPVDLPAVAATVIDRVRLEYPELQASTSWPDGLPRVWADPDKVEQVLSNLLENACKYASPTGLTVTGTVEQGGVTVRVADRGEGIPAADLLKVFTKFFHRSVGRPSGSGLGLWISRGLVEAHGGRLVASSIPGEGSVFAFTLPVMDLEQPTAS
ncbi:MAG TPA: ATP-binding protein [Acidimicrobiales bacterium]|nr:ATP-binding protein [Acidimicrobiales bacterium]